MDNKKFLITGGAGFIGNTLSAYLLEKGHSVTCLDNLSTGSFENVSRLTGNDKYKFIYGKVEDEELSKKLVEESDVVIHLAAVVGVNLIVENPLETINTNIHGSEIILNLASRYHKNTLIASTSEVYGKSAKIPFRENDDVIFGSTTHSRWGYAMSKAIDEMIALGCHVKYGLPVVVVRLFNTIGPRQTGKYGMVVPRFIKAGLEGKPLQVYGTGTQTRCFTYVDDVVSAIYRLLDTPTAIGEVFNIGNSQEVSILELAEKIIEYTGNKSVIERIPYEQAYGNGFEDMQRRVPCLEKIKSYIDYTPQYTLDDSILKIIEHMEKK